MEYDNRFKYNTWAPKYAINAVVILIANFVALHSFLTYVYFYNPENATLKTIASSLLEMSTKTFWYTKHFLRLASYGCLLITVLRYKLWGVRPTLVRLPRGHTIPQLHLFAAVVWLGDVMMCAGFSVNTTIYMCQACYGQA